MVAGDAPTSTGVSWTDELTGIIANFDDEIPNVYIEADCLTDWGDKSDERYGEALLPEFKAELRHLREDETPGHFEPGLR